MEKEMSVQFTDNSKDFLDAMQSATIRALEKCGITAEGYAKKLCPVDTGTLRNSISHNVDASEGEVYIGTNNEYAAYVELGTGKYYPGGRKDPWTYQDANGNWRMTDGQRARPYLKPAVTDHAAQYHEIIENELKNG